MQELPDARQHAPATARNRAPLTGVLASWLPTTGAVLEVASGTGEHVVHWAEVFADLTWQPSDTGATALASIEAWRAHAAAANLRPPLAFDVTGDWRAAVPGPWAAIVAVNLLHISPWTTGLALLDGAARTLTENGRLIVYGPFAEDGVIAPESNVAFDATLRAQDPAWGLRDVRDVAAAAAARGLRLTAEIAMPANNRVLVLQRAPRDGA